MKNDPSDIKARAMAQYQKEHADPKNYSCTYYNTAWQPPASHEYRVVKADNGIACCLVEKVPTGCCPKDSAVYPTPYIGPSYEEIVESMTNNEK